VQSACSRSKLQTAQTSKQHKDANSLAAVSRSAISRRLRRLCRAPSLGRTCCSPGPTLLPLVAVAPASCCTPPLAPGRLRVMRERRRGEAGEAETARDAGAPERKAKPPPGLVACVWLLRWERIRFRVQFWRQGICMHMFRGPRWAALSWAVSSATPAPWSGISVVRHFRCVHAQNRSRSRSPNFRKR